MNARSIITGLLLLLAAGGIIYVLAGGQEQATQVEPNPAAVDPGQINQPGSGGATEAANLETRDDLPIDGVVVYYFHGRQRCYTCNKMETLAEATIVDRFGDHLREGWVVFKPVNMQTPEGSHFVQDFELRSAGIVMVERHGSQDLRWRRLDEVWTKIRNEEDYRTYIADNLTECLREINLEKI